MMYIVFIINYIRHLINKSKMLTFVYISDWREYVLTVYYNVAISGENTHIQL